MVASLMWATVGPFVGLVFASLTLIIILLFMEQLLISLSGACPVKDQRVLDSFNAQVFKLGLGPRKLYYTEKFKTNLFDLPSIFSSKGSLISKDLIDSLTKDELDIVFYGVLYKSTFMDSFLDKLGAILFSFIRFPECNFGLLNKKMEFFLYLVFKFLLSPLEILEKKFFDKDGIPNRISDEFFKLGKDSMVLIALTDKIKSNNEDDLQVRNFSFQLIYTSSLWPYNVADLSDLFFDLAPNSKQSWKSI